MLMPPPKDPPLGITLSLTEGAGAPEFFDAFLWARAHGLGLAYHSVKWSELEPSPGSYRLDKLRQDLSGLSNVRFKVLVNIHTINTNVRELPADLQGEAFDSPKVLERWERLLRAVAPVLPDSVRWISLGNEADVYLGMHPEEETRFLRFLAAGRKVVKDLRPGLSVGVTTTYDGVVRRRTLSTSLHADSDVVILTYYPLGENGLAEPESALSAFRTMVEFAGSRKLAMQEIGYPADASVGSSEEKQAAFVKAVFAALREHKSRLAFANWFLLTDFGSSVLDQLERYYGISTQEFRAFLATLGLRKADGTPRKALAAFEQEAKKGL